MAICSCRLCSPLPKLGAQRCQISGFLRSVPSPQQGTSHTMRSTPPRANAGRRCAGWHTIASRAAAAPNASQRRTNV